MNRRGDPLTREVTRRLARIVGPAREKADLLVDELRCAHPALPAISPRGLADAVHRLRTNLDDAQILAGADALMARLQRDYDARETVT